MAKFSAGDAVKLRDDVEYDERYNGFMLYGNYMAKGKKYTIKQPHRSDDAYQIVEGNCYVGENALEAWPESTEETRSNEIDPQLFELVKAALTGLCANYAVTYRHRNNLVWEEKASLHIAKETLRLLREEKL